TIIEELRRDTVDGLGVAAPERVGKASRRPRLLHADQAIPRVPREAGRRRSAGDRRQVAVRVVGQLVRTERELAGGAGVGGAGARRRQQGASEAPPDADAVTGGVVLIAQVPQGPRAVLVDQRREPRGVVVLVLGGHAVRQRQDSAPARVVVVKDRRLSAPQDLLQS